MLTICGFLFWLYFYADSHPSEGCNPMDNLYLAILSSAVGLFTFILTEDFVKENNDDKLA